MPHPSSPEAPKPSAYTTATLRAAHQLLDAPLILDDPLAVAILGPAREAELRGDLQLHRNPFSEVLRATMAVRSRLAEDTWHHAQRHGARQYVLLGAGLDTYAYRAGAVPDATIFEVDLPATQAWKRSCLEAAGIAVPDRVRYCAVDFSETELEHGLDAAGFDSGQPAVFCWLGVSMYLDPGHVARTLRFAASCAPGSRIVFDYVLAPELLTPMERGGLHMIASRLAAQGEPLLSHFPPAALEDLLHQCGFGQVEQFAAAELGARYLSGRDDGLRLSGVFQLVRATV